MELRALIVCLLLLAVLSARAQEQVIDGVAAIVNGDVITFSQVRELTMPQEIAVRQSYATREEMEQQIRDIRIQAINDLIDRQLVLQAFNKNKFNIPEFAIDEHINSIIRENFKGDRQAFIRTLQAQGFTLQRFRKIETEKMMLQAMRGQAVKVDPVISPGKIEKFYRQNIADYSTTPKIKLRMLVMNKNTPGARNTMDELRAKVRNGEDFGQLAGLYTEDASKKESGGDWGWLEPGTLHASLAKPAFALKAGQVSGIVELGDNYYLLYAEARKEGSTKPLNAIREEITKRVLQAERQEAQDKWIKGLREKAHIKVF